MLKRTHDRKTASSVNAAGTQSNIANAFSLPAGVSCPGMTSVCGSICYASKLERLYPSFRNLVTSNYDALSQSDFAGMVRLLDPMITEFERECDKRGAEKKFRIHADGDMFSTTYAQAWAYVIRKHPDTQFWAYTRSFTPVLNVVPWLAGISNLSLLLSVDAANQADAERVREDFPEVRWAMLAQTFGEAKDAMLDVLGRPGGACPEQTGALPLVDKAGGACVRCDLCVSGKADIRFSISKR